MSKVSLVAKIEAKDGKGDELVSAFGTLLTHTAAEDGTIHYVLHRSSTEPNVFFVTEIYENQAALDSHMGSDTFKAFGASLGDIIAGADMQFLVPVAVGKGLEL